MSYRVLAIDGGGTWALIPVKALIQIYGEAALGHAVLSDFDMVAANSGGSIVLGALVENLPLGKILDLFEDEATRKSIFSKTDSTGDRVLHDLTQLGPKYSSENKLSALQNALPQTGTTALSAVANGIRRAGSNADIHLLITAFDYDRTRATFFRSSGSSGPEWGTGAPSDVTLAEAIHASTNAPVNYFDAPATFPDRAGRYWDGAIAGCNNPVLAGVTEAIVRRQTPTDIVALSIGTGSVVLPLANPGDPASPYLKPLGDPGLVADLKKLAASILDDPPDAATFVAHVMTGSGIGLNAPAADSRIVRMNPLISPVRDATGKWKAPGTMTAAQFAYLAKLDMDAVEQPQVDAIATYADLWIQSVAPNQPIRMDGATFAVELGQDRFTPALAAWNAIR